MRNVKCETLTATSRQEACCTSKWRAVRVVNHIAENALDITLAVSLGQIRTLIEHPASMTHSSIPPEAQMEAGIHPGGLRMSLGIEDVRDILQDLEDALEEA
ncbi:MAG: hypothetical protein C4340_01530 [Armatimonadota bacterium]